MKRERLVILLGLLIALIFFYFGLNEWLKSKEEQVKPPPVVIKPAPVQKEALQTVAPPPVEKPMQEEKKEDLIAKKIKEEVQKPSEKSVVSKPKEAVNKTLRIYMVQVGAFKDKEKAERVAEKAKKMGYSVKIVEEDYFYKVRLVVHTDNIESELNKLRKSFGSAIIKQ